tara:strand:- start:63 stop:314 length:252 start_codon:yes stop_codon:yes gene_type:complete
MVALWLVVSGVDDQMHVQGMGGKEEMELLLEQWIEWLSYVGSEPLVLEGERWRNGAYDWVRLVYFDGGQDLEPLLKMGPRYRE